MNEYTVFAQYGMVDFEDKKSKKETEAKNYLVGVGRQDKINDKTTMFTKLQYSQEENSALKPKSKDQTAQFVPVTLGLEHDAASWLTVRGSVSQNLWSKDKDKFAKTNKTEANSTSVNVGATLKFGDFSVDGVVGAGNTTNGTVGDTSAQKGVLSLDNAMTRVSMTYKF